MTKKQLVESILSTDSTYKKAELMKKTVSQLEEINKDLKKEEPKINPISLDNIDPAILELLKAQLLGSQEMQQKEVAKEEKKVRKEIDKNLLVPCMNATNGLLIYSSRRTGSEWRWTEYGDVEYIEVQELLTMRSSQRKFLEEPFIFVLDEEVVEYLNLATFYEKLEHIETIDEVFTKKQDEFERIVEQSPKSVKALICSRALKKYEDGTLESVKKINFLNNRFNMFIGQR